MRDDRADGGIYPHGHYSIIGINYLSLHYSELRDWELVWDISKKNRADDSIIRTVIIGIIAL